MEQCFIKECIWYIVCYDHLSTLEEHAWEHGNFELGRDPSQTNMQSMHAKALFMLMKDVKDKIFARYT